MRVPLLQPRQNENPYSWEQGRHYAESGVGETLGAASEDAWYYSPFSSLIRRGEDFEAEGKQFEQDYGLDFGEDTNTYEEPRLSEKEWRDTVNYREGLQFPDGVHPNIAKLYADRYDERQARQKILDNAPEGFLMSSGIFMTELLTSSLDPINLATAFVPVLGATSRFTGGAATVAAKRFGTGFAGAAATTALTEPLVLSQSMREQSDYTANDVLLSIAFGGLLGGSINAGVGAWRDVRGKNKDSETSETTSTDTPTPTPKENIKYESPVVGVDPQGHLNVLRIAMAQMEDGRKVDVLPAIKVEQHNTARKSASTTTPKTFIPVVNEEGVKRSFPNQRAAKRWVDGMKKHGDIKSDKEVSIRENSDGTFSIVKSTTAHFEPDSNGKVKIYNSKREANAAKKKADGSHVVEIPHNGKGKRYAVLVGASDADAKNIMGKVSRDGTHTETIQNLNMDTRPSFRNFMEVHEPQDPILLANEINEDIKSNFATQSDDVVEIETPKAANDNDWIDGDILELETSINREALPDDIANELKSIDEVINKSEQIEQAFDIAAACMRTS